jgi:ADP-ribose pyrophosphatase YjhB (NUDIX family)
MKQLIEDQGGLLDAFRFCPRCAFPRPRIEHNRQLRCDACGLRFFFNTAAAAAAFILAGEELMLCVRAHEPGQGLWDVPGGFIEFDETIEDGLRREIREELNIELAELHYLTSAPNDYLFAEIPYKTADMFFVGVASNPDDAQPADDVADIVRIHPQSVDPARFAFESTRRAFAVLLQRLGYRPG